MDVICIVLVLLLSSARTGLVLGVKWMSIATLSSAVDLQQKGVCDSLTALVRQQKAICRRNLDVMGAVRSGARSALEECQHQLRHRRWNCSVQAKTGGAGGAGVFGKALSTGTREAAFVHALSSAGVAHAVTRHCSAGFLPRCGCDSSLDGGALPPSADPPSGAGGAGAGAARGAGEGFTWAGCSDNIEYGTAFAQLFVDAREKVIGSEEAVRVGLMNLHNNNAGRKAVQELMTVQCKCHGVSGSCELRTCWQALPAFRDVSALLLQRFDQATEVVHRRIGTRSELVPKAGDHPPLDHSSTPGGTAPSTHPPQELQLVYLDNSPDFCERGSGGWPGTRGRACERASGGPQQQQEGGCEAMCCGRGFSTHQVTVMERCACKFHWCCEVRCQQCAVEVNRYTCR